MSEEKENKASDKKDETTEPRNNVGENKVVDKKTVSTEKSKSRFNLAVPVILVIILSIAFVLVNKQLGNIEQELNQNHIKNSSVSENSANQIKEILSGFASVQRKLDELESKQEVLAHTLSQPVEEQIHINKDYALSEIEYLLIIASYNLQLNHDVATALAAMELADTRLKGLTDPAVISVREQLIADMNELRSINQADLSGTAFSLSDFINRVDKLVLKENVVIENQEIATEKNEESVEGIKHFFTLVFKELKSLIVITRDKDVGKARLLPDEVYFLRANLKLELANARFAVFNRDTENLRVSIDHIQDWLDNYFDLVDADVRNIYDSLSSMKKVELKLPDLDISSSLESVRALGRYQSGNSNETIEELIPQQ